jgi:hypothetical protein
MKAPFKTVQDIAAMALPEVERLLESGYEWMKRTTDDDKRNDFYNDKWMPLLAIYTSACSDNPSEQDAVRRLLNMEKPLPEPSAHIEQLREQLILGGTADVERRPIDRRT